MPASDRSRLRRRVARLLLTAFGLGAVPKLPGTAASLAVAALVGLLAAGPTTTLGICALLVFYGVFVTLFFMRDVGPAAGQRDPAWVVSDEVAGQALACVGAVPLGCSWPAVLAAFLTFRLLDISKPWPVGALERVPGAWGVLLDDVAAGVIAGAAVFAAGSLLAG